MKPVTEEHFVPAPIRSAAHPRGRRDETADLVTCHQILAAGSKSFAAASRLLPSRMRDPAAAFYAFCRVADDLVDFSDDPSRAVDELRGRIDCIYAGAPDNDPVDRAFCRVVERFELPRAVVEALIEGFAWDAQEREYETMDDLMGYCARVASAVGVVMTVFMGERDRRTLARACDLGVAMQLTNICRDVAEDAGRARLYLPAAWLRDRDMDPAHFTHNHLEYVGDPRLAGVVEAVLTVADEHYLRASAGLAMLPRDCRPAIRAAGLIYADIGRVLRGQGCDPLRGRAHTTTLRKLWLLARAWARPTPQSTDAHRNAPAIPACEFLLADFPELSTPDFDSA